MPMPKTEGWTGWCLTSQDLLPGPTVLRSRDAAIQKYYHIFKA